MRNPWPAAFLGLTVLGPLVLVLVLSIAWHREQLLRRDAERERERVTQSYRQRMTTLEFMADRLLEELPVAPGTSEIRQRLERDFLRHFREVIDGTEETASVYFADACAQYAYYAQAFGHLNEARDYYERAVAERRLANLAEARSAYDESVKIRRSLVKRYPGDVAACEGLGRSLNNLANLYVACNELEQARTTFAEALEQREGLTILKPCGRTARWPCSVSRQTFSNCWRSWRQPATGIGNPTQAAQS